MHVSHGSLGQPLREPVASGHAALVFEVVDECEEEPEFEIIDDDDANLKPTSVSAATCHYCDARTALRRCTRCYAAAYCSVRCQRAAWLAGHREVCPSVPSPEQCISTQRSDFALEADQFAPTPLRSPYEKVASLYVERMLPVLLEAHASGAWSEYHTSGLIDQEDAKLLAHSSELKHRISERLFNCSLGECLERANLWKQACTAYEKSTLLSNGWVEVYHRWIAALQKTGSESDLQSAKALAVERGVWRHALQRPNDLYVPCLLAQPAWDPSCLKAVRELEAAFPVIREEYRRLRADAERGLWTTVADTPLVAAGDWTDFKLVENGKFHPVNCCRCPETMDLILRNCPEVATQVRGSIIFSRLSAGTVIRPHCGPTNTRLRVHLGLEVADSCPRIRVGDTWHTWKEGACIVFDDSFEHEVVHDGSEARIVLIADLWHPDFSDTMREKYLHGRHRRRYKGATTAVAAARATGSTRDAVLAAAREFEHHRVDSLEVRFLERELCALEEVKDAAVIVRMDKEDHQMMLAYIECRSGSVDPDHVCDCCAKRLEAYCVSSLVLAVREWPRTNDGEIDRDRLPPPPQGLV